MCVFCFDVGLLALCFPLAFDLLDWPAWVVFCVGVDLFLVFSSLAVKFTYPWDLRFSSTSEGVFDRVGFVFIPEYRSFDIIFTVSLRESLSSKIVSYFSFKEDSWALNTAFSSFNLTIGEEFS